MQSKIILIVHTWHEVVLTYCPKLLRPRDLRDLETQGPEAVASLGPWVLNRVDPIGRSV